MEVGTRGNGVIVGLSCLERNAHISINRQQPVNIHGLHTIKVTNFHRKLLTFEVGDQFSSKDAIAKNTIF